MQYVFVITYGRSGSTVLMKFLNSIDGYCIRGENNGILSHFAAGIQMLRQAQADQENSKQTPDAPWYGLHDTNTKSIAKGIADLFTREVLRPHDGARAIGFKEIRFTPEDISDEDYDAVIDFMAAEFPNSRFIFNTRNWRQVVRSGWWRLRPDLGRLRACIEQSDARFKNSKELLGDRAFLIDFSEFKGKPEGFRTLLDWLGEEMSDEQLVALTEKKLTHVKGQYDERGFYTKARRALYWYLVDNRAFKRS